MPSTIIANASATLVAQLLAQTGPPAAPSVAVQSVWDFLVKGGPMIVPIALGSLVALTVIIERLVSLRRARIIPPGFLGGLREAFDADDPAPALEFCRANESPLANVLRAGLLRLDASESRRERLIAQAGAREVFHLRKHLRVLSVVATLAPVLGLLGTVFGMIKAFQTVAVAGEALGKTELLAKGIYEALITTAAGLLLAIPALIAYHWLSARVARLVHDMDEIVIAFFREQVTSATTPASPKLVDDPEPDEVREPAAATA